MVAANKGALMRRQANDEAEKRSMYERDGFTTALALPSPGGCQRNHAGVLQNGDDHLTSVLKGMDIKLLSIDRSVKQQIKVHFGGAACKKFFAVEEKEGRKLNMAKPINYQHFWGMTFCGRAYQESQDKETELVARLDTVQLKNRMEADTASIQAHFKHIIDARAEDVCSAIIAVSKIAPNNPAKERVHGTRG